MCINRVWCWLKRKLFFETKDNRMEISMDIVQDIVFIHTDIRIED